MKRTDVDTYERVAYVDFIGDGFRYDDWPRGYYLTHGAEGTVIGTERGTDGIPDRPIVSFTIGWFYRFRQRQGYYVPECVFEKDSYNPKVIIGNKSRHQIVVLADRKEVRRVEEKRQKVEEILQTMKWADVVMYVPDGEERTFLLRNHKQTEEGLPPEITLVVRRIAAYNFLQFTYKKEGNEALGVKYERLLNVQIMEMERLAQVHNIIIPRRAAKQQERRTTEMAKAAKVEKVEKVEKEAPVAAAPAKKKGKGFDKEDIKAALATVKAEEAPLIRIAKEKFGVSIPKGSLVDAPNPGVMKMRAGNAIRNALKTAGQFSG